jgi:hypothetical protein
MTNDQWQMANDPVLGLESWVARVPAPGLKGFLHRYISTFDHIASAPSS